MLSGCARRENLSGPPFGQAVSEDRIIRAIVTRLEKHGSFRFTYSGIVSNSDDPGLAAILEYRPAEGQARTDLSLWWATRFVNNAGLPDPEIRETAWTVKARSQEGTFTNSHYLERTCRKPFQPFNEKCVLYFGEYSGLWPTDDYHVTLRKTANKYIAWSRRFKRIYKLVDTTTTNGIERYTYRAEYQTAPSDPRVYMVEYTVSADTTLHRYRGGLLGEKPLGVVTTELFGFGEEVNLPVNPLPGER